MMKDLDQGKALEEIKNPFDFSGDIDLNDQEQPKKTEQEPKVNKFEDDLKQAL